MSCAHGALHALRVVGITFGYLAIGCIFYHLVEEKDCENSDVPGCKESWTLVDSWYFATVTISTVGYGDLTPSSNGSKAFTIIYIFLGITVVFNEIASGFSGGLQHIEDWFLSKMDRFDASGQDGISGQQKGLSGKKIDLSGDGIADFVEPPSSLIFWTQRLAPWLTLAVTFQFISAAVFCAVEPDLSYFDAFYHGFVTATTVGYGDISLTKQESRVVAIFHILFSVTLFAALVGRVQELVSIRNSELKRSQVLKSQLDSNWIASICEEMDKDGKGVDKTEFVVGMLTRLGVELCGEPLHWNDVQPILAQFDAADKTHDGRLNADDLRKMTEAKKQAVQAAKAAKGICAADTTKVVPIGLSEEEPPPQTLPPPPPSEEPPAT